MCIIHRVLRTKYNEYQNRMIHEVYGIIIVTMVCSSIYMLFSGGLGYSQLGLARQSTRGCRLYPMFIATSAQKKTYHEVSPFGQACQMLNGFLGEPVGFEQGDDLGDSSVRFFKQLIGAKPMPRLFVFVAHPAQPAAVSARSLSQVSCVFVPTISPLAWRS